jgi:hypothetical protein
MMFNLTVLAYIGPGPGLSMLVTLLGLLVTLVFALWAVALWPYRVLRRRWRERRKNPSIER